jgi:hypothetical protein
MGSEYQEKIESELLREDLAKYRIILNISRSG